LFIQEQQRIAVVDPETAVSHFWPPGGVRRPPQAAACRVRPPRTAADMLLRPRADAAAAAAAGAAV